MNFLNSASGDSEFSSCDPLFNAFLRRFNIDGAVHRRFIKMRSIPVLTKRANAEKQLRFSCAISLITICLAGILIMLSPAWPAESIGCISLEGVYRFSPGDNLLWASPALDDCSWAKVKVPGDLADQGVHVKGGMGWYRTRFRVPDVFEHGDPALAMGNVGNADEVYLNGIKIGGEGKIGDGFVEAPWKERLYPIPKGLLRYGGENLLAIRILNTYRMAGIFEGPVCIGDYKDLIAKNIGLEFRRKAGEVVLFTLSFLFLLGSIFLVAQGVRTPEYRSFILFLTLYIALLVLESLHFYDAGLKTPFAQRCIFVLGCLLPASGLLFLLCLYREPMGRWVKAVMAASFLLGLLFLSFSSYEAYSLLMSMWLVFFGCSGGTVLFLAVRARVRRRHEAGPVLLGIVGLLGSACIDFTPIGGNWHVWPLIPSDLGMVFLLLCFAYALMARYARVGKTVKQLSGRILEAQQEERKRLSRDIHDGPGQSLMALKLQLQMMNARTQGKERHAGDVLPELIDEVDTTIKELRTMAMDLRPTFLQDGSIIQLFILYGRLFTERTGLPVDVAGEKGPEMPMRVKDNLYRIYQEALGNIAKHARADRVLVRVKNGNGSLVVTIRDDGMGFDAVGELNAPKGIGLMSMKERAELFGGVFGIESAPGMGCTIHVEAPIK